MQIQKIIIVTLGLLVGTAVHAGPVDLTSWVTDNSFDFPGNQGAGVWNVSVDGTSVTESVNGDASIFRSGVAVTDLALSGTFYENSGDDDFIGFVFGFGGSGFYLFDWKQGTQNAYGTASKGMKLKRFNSTPTSNTDLWADSSSVADVLFSNSVGRTNGLEYGFDLFRDVTTGEISIDITQGTTTIESFTVFDTTYGSGEFGFYNFSEDAVTYSGFTADAVELPTPATWLLILAGLGMMSTRVLRCQ